MSAALLSAEEARQRAEEALLRHWPEWRGTLQPLMDLHKPQMTAAFRITGAPLPAVIKLWAPAQADKAAAQANRQRAVALDMDNGPFRAPAVLAFDPQACALIMQAVQGADLLDSLSRRDDTAALDLLERAGGWLAAHHAPSLQPHPFRPKGHVNWLHRLIGQMHSGDRKMPEPARFEAAALALCDGAEQLRRLPATRAITHRDMTLANLLEATDGTLWGIDFENAREDEPLRDVFSLGVDVLAFAPCGHDPARALAALARGYGDRQTAPAVRLFLQRAFALGVWARTPATPSRRHLGLLDAAHWVLAQDEPVL